MLEKQHGEEEVSGAGQIDVVLAVLSSRVTQEQMNDEKLNKKSKQNAPTSL